MSQLSHLLLQGTSVTAFQPSVGSRVTPVNNKIYVFGDGINIATGASGNTVYASLNNSIIITSATIGNVTISGNTIGTAVGFNLSFAPVGSGKLAISYANNGTVPVINSSNQIISSDPLTNGRLIIGRSGNTPVAAQLTAGSGITITNDSGNITITGSSSTNGNAGVLQWGVQTYTGSENRNYTVYPNNGYFANSTIGTLSYPDNSSYCPRSPIFYTVAPTINWKVGDALWVANRNKGNYQVQFQSDQGGCGGNIVGSYFTTYPSYGACASSGGLDSTVASGTQARSYTRTYGSILWIYIGSANFSSAQQLNNGNVIYKQYDNIFMSVNTMGMPAGCGGSCVQ